MYHKRGVWAIKAKNGGAFPKHEKKAADAAPIPNPVAILVAIKSHNHNYDEHHGLEPKEPEKTQKICKLWKVCLYGRTGRERKQERFRIAYRKICKSLGMFLDSIG
ncbi:hypothetical protein Tco_1267128 [Tanacetum coccineum]